MTITAPDYLLFVFFLTQGALAVFMVGVLIRTVWEYTLRFLWNRRGAQNNTDWQNRIIHRARVLRDNVQWENSPEDILRAQGALFEALENKE